MGAKEILYFIKGTMIMPREERTQVSPPGGLGGEEMWRQDGDWLKERGTTP